MSTNINKICNTLTTDFNTNILDTVDSVIREEFKYVEEKFKDGILQLFHSF